MMSITRNVCLRAVRNGNQSARRTIFKKAAEKELITETSGNKAILTLNRSQEMNGLTLDLTTDLISTLKNLENDRNVSSIVFKANGSAFCTGMDLKAAAKVAENRNATLESIPGLISSYFQLYHILANLKKPNVTLIDGIVTSTATGLAFNHTYSVGTEKAIFAMHESSFGLVPDCYFANKMPGKLGLFLALTGNTLEGRELYNAGLTTHYVRSARLADLETDIKKVDDIDAVIDGVCRYRKFGENYKREAVSDFYKIESVMQNVDSIESLMENLRKDNSEWASDQLATLENRSPISLKITLKLFEMTAKMELKESLNLQYRVMKRLLAGQDFQEGIRAAFANRDAKPKWSKKLSDIDGNTVESYFKPLRHDELQL